MSWTERTGTIFSLGPMTEYEARSPAALMRVEQTLRELVAN